MLIEQIIQFELKEHGPLAVHVLVQLVIFMTKHKSLRKNFEWIIFYGWNIAEGNAFYFSLLTKVKHKMQNF